MRPTTPSLDVPSGNQTPNPDTEFEYFNRLLEDREMSGGRVVRAGLSSLTGPRLVWGDTPSHTPTLTLPYSG